MCHDRQAGQTAEGRDGFHVSLVGSKRLQLSIRTNRSASPSVSVGFCFRKLPPRPGGAFGSQSTRRVRVSYYSVHYGAAAGICRETAYSAVVLDAIRLVVRPRNPPYLAQSTPGAVSTNTLSDVHDELRRAGVVFRCYLCKSGSKIMNCSSRPTG